MSDNVAISIQNVSKTFKLPHEKNTSIKGAVINFYKRKKKYEQQRVLNDVSFDINKGEFFGIVGRNGNGKSTMLKMLAGIYAPTKGEVHINGKLTPFIELGVGFNHELTGRENVYLNGALLGFDRKEVDKMYDEIVAFAELENFMDQKLKNYSSGMQVRLAFSIAIRAKSDILLLDEVLAVGDAAFQKKCLEHFSLLKANKQTVVFVSHDMASVQKYCDRVAWIDKGVLRALGDPQTITREYLETFITQQEDQEKRGDNDLPLGIASAIDIDESLVKLSKVRIEDANGSELKSLGDKQKDFFVSFDVKALKTVNGIVPGVIITNGLDEFITASNSKWGGYAGPEKLTKGSTYKVRFKMLNIFEAGDYKVSVNVVSKDLGTFYAWKNKARRLEVTKSHLTGGKVNPQFDVEVIKL